MKKKIKSNHAALRFFSAPGMRWWLLMVSFIPGAGVLTIQSLLESGRKDLLLLFFEPAIASAFGIVFFAPLWMKLNINHEGELILKRFHGKGAKILYLFRNYFLGIVVIPLLVSIQLAVVSTIELFEFNSQIILLVFLAILVLFSVLGYSFERMIQFEVTIAFITVVISITHLFISDVQNRELNLLLDPESIDWSFILLPLFVFWWFSGLVDMPDMRAQKLLNSTNRREIVWKLSLPFFALFSLQSIFLWKPLSLDQPFYNSIVLMLLLNQVVLILSWMHWATSLIHQVIPEHRKMVLGGAGTMNKGIMILVVLLAMVWLGIGRSVQNLFSSILLMTAGVGPIYLLRWTWYRVNAWTQLSVMLGAIVISPLVLLFFTDLSYYPQLLISGTINLIVALTVMMITKNQEEEQKAKIFILQLGVLDQFRNVRVWLHFVLLSAVFIGLLFLVCLI